MPVSIKNPRNSPVRVANNQPEPPPADEGGLGISDPTRRQRLRLPPGVDSEGLYRTAAIIDFLSLNVLTASFLRDTFCPKVVEHLSEHVWIDYVTYGQRKRLAPFVSHYAKGSVVPREKYRTHIFTPPKVAPIRVLTSDDLYSRAPNALEGMHDAEVLLEDLMTLDMMIQKTEEWMTAKLLFEGTVPCIDFDTGRLLSTIDYGTPIETVIDKPWDDPTAQPLTHLKACMRLVGAEAGAGVDTIVMGKTAADLFENHESVLNMFNKLFVKAGELTPKMSETGVYNIGNYRGIDIVADEQSFVNKAGDTEYYVPEDVVLVGVSKAGGGFSYGAIGQKMQDADRLELIPGRRVPLIWFPENSDVRKLRLACRPAPISPFKETWTYFHTTTQTPLARKAA